MKLMFFQDNSSYKTRFEKIVEDLEDIVDPFDLNVFSPYISSNLNKHLQRCGVSVTYIDDVIKIFFQHEKTIFISSSYRVMFFVFYMVRSRNKLTENI